MNLEVGNLIYILNASPPRLIPCQIVEQIVSRRTNGESITHIISTSNGKTYKLEDLKAPWFSSIDSAQTYLTDQATKLVEETISRGSLLAKESFSQFSDNSESITQQSISEITDKEELTITLENGTKARVKLPEVLK